MMNERQDTSININAICPKHEKLLTKFVIESGYLLRMMRADKISISSTLQLLA